MQEVSDCLVRPTAAVGQPRDEIGGRDDAAEPALLLQESDQPAICALFDMGVREGQGPDSDTGEDLTSFLNAYCSDEGMSGFWVASRR